MVPGEFGNLKGNAHDKMKKEAKPASFYIDVTLLNLVQQASLTADEVYWLKIGSL